MKALVVIAEGMDPTLMASEMADGALPWFKQLRERADPERVPESHLRAFVRDRGRVVVVDDLLDAALILSTAHRREHRDDDASVRPPELRLLHLVGALHLGVASHEGEPFAASTAARKVPIAVSRVR